MPGDAGPSVDQVFSAVGHRVLTMYPGDEEGRMLRSPGLKTAGKLYAFARHAPGQREPEARRGGPAADP